MDVKFVSQYRQKVREKAFYFSVTFTLHIIISIYLSSIYVRNFMKRSL